MLVFRLLCDLVKSRIRSTKFVGEDNLCPCGSVAGVSLAVDEISDVGG